MWAGGVGCGVGCGGDFAIAASFSSSAFNMFSCICCCICKNIFSKKAFEEGSSLFAAASFVVVASGSNLFVGELTGLFLLSADICFLRVPGW